MLKSELSTWKASWRQADLRRSRMKLLPCDGAHRGYGGGEYASEARVLGPRLRPPEREC